MDHCSKSYVRFLPQSLDFIPNIGEGWTPSRRLILFEFEVTGGYLQLKIVLGPGSTAARETIHRFIVGHPNVFNRAAQKLYPMWWSFHSERWVSKKRYSDAELEELKNEIKGRFARFKEKDLPEMVEILGRLRELRLETRP